VKLVQGDITTIEVDAIVNAANPSLMGGGGVDGAIHRKGGTAILEECKRIRREEHSEGLPTGHAVATTAGDLPARWVIHTVGPVYAEGEDRSHLLASCHTESLKVADELGAASIAFPAISTGIYGYPLEPAAEIALAATSNAVTTNVDEVLFVLFEPQALRVFEEAHERIQRRKGQSS
jgi:O-acetyl-ADP-ribose deacetylase (regulator of RNase III)